MSISRYTRGLETLKKEQPEDYKRISKTLRDLVEVNKLKAREQRALGRDKGKWKYHKEEIKKYDIFINHISQQFIKEREEVKSDLAYDVLGHIYNAIFDRD